MQNCTAKQIASTYVENVGLEIEAFASSKLLHTVGGGSVIGEAGKDQIEFITDPCGSVDESMMVLEEMHEQIDGVVWYTPYRPSHLRYKRLWNDKPRYNALRTALEIEAPGQSRLVRNMTMYASIHVNFSGRMIDPFGPDGIFLINLFNNLSPFLASRVHDETGLGRGHLAIWRKFAKEERFPLADRWFASVKEMVDYIESVPPLFRVVSDGKSEELLVYPGGNQSVSIATDLTFMWWFLRPKIGLQGPYLELRYLPSMPLVYAKKYVRQAVGMIEAALDWYHGPNFGQPVCSRDEASSVSNFLQRQFEGYVPASLLSETEWKKYVRL